MKKKISILLSFALILLSITWLNNNVNATTKNNNFDKSIEESIDIQASTNNSENQTPVSTIEQNLDNNISFEELTKKEIEEIIKLRKLTEKFEELNIFSDVPNYDNTNTVTIKNRDEINKIFENSIFKKPKKDLSSVRIDLNGEIESMELSSEKKKANNDKVNLNGQNIPTESIYLKDCNGYFLSNCIPVYNINYSKKAIYPKQSNDSEDGNLIFTLKPVKDKTIPIDKIDEEPREVTIEIVDLNKNEIVATINSTMKGVTLKSWKINKLNIKHSYYFKVTNPLNTYGYQYIIY